MNTSDKDLLSSGLLSVKHMTMMYNDTACQTDDPQLARELCEMISEEHMARIRLFEAMHQRGWYNPQLIDEQQLRQSQQKLQQQMQQTPNQWQQTNWQQTNWQQATAGQYQQNWQQAIAGQGQQNTWQPPQTASQYPQNWQQATSGQGQQNTWQNQTTAGRGFQNAGAQTFAGTKVQQ